MLEIKWDKTRNKILTTATLVAGFSEERIYCPPRRHWGVCGTLKPDWRCYRLTRPTAWARSDLSPLK